MRTSDTGIKTEGSKLPFRPKNEGWNLYTFVKNIAKGVLVYTLFDVIVKSLAPSTTNTYSTTTLINGNSTNPDRDTSTALLAQQHRLLQQEENPVTVPFSDVCNGGIVQQQFTACTEQLGETRKSCSFLIDHLQNTGNVQSNSTATVIQRVDGLDASEVQISEYIQGNATAAENHANCVAVDSQLSKVFEHYGINGEFQIIFTPTADPTAVPTFMPTYDPSQVPTPSPTENPTFQPTVVGGTHTPTESPTVSPTTLPTAAPSPVPSELPTIIVPIVESTNSTLINGTRTEQELVTAFGNTEGLQLASLAGKLIQLGLGG